MRPLSTGGESSQSESFFNRREARWNEFQLVAKFHYYLNYIHQTPLEISFYLDVNDMDEERRRIALAAGAAVIVVTACAGMVIIMEQGKRIMMFGYILYMYWRKRMLEEEMEDEMIIRVLKRKREHEWWVRPKSSHFYGELLLPNLDEINFHKLFRVTRYV
jgi:hypothetical protein